MNTTPTHYDAILAAIKDKAKYSYLAYGKVVKHMEINPWDYKGQSGAWIDELSRLRKEFHDQMDNWRMDANRPYRPR